jgi:hypothetical protein
MEKYRQVDYHSPQQPDPTATRCVIFNHAAGTYHIGKLTIAF